MKTYLDKNISLRRKGELDEFGKVIYDEHVYIPKTSVREINIILKFVPDEKNLKEFMKNENYKIF